ncbi:hypothetical protein HU230_0011995 [Bradyrhizobium quebecense]|uniref:Uncharacterized protein n=1 Tax=Bradyrhizobium quebecense TaxID=2748629 RepID=A0A974AAY2_9BRAD|nr:hypothetical protein [Bradyrhizobium quebecense]UGA46713.1 hypothetical protein HU230_0011995 [Bradyrhizobium quebecense]
MADEAKSKGAVVPAAANLRLSIPGIQVSLPRTARALDRIVSVPFEGLAGYVEGKFGANVDAHIDAVEQVRKRKGQASKVDNPTIERLERIDNWIANAGKVDPTDPEMSAVWRGVLDEILNDSDDAKELIDVVRGAPRSDIRLFLWNFRRKGRSIFGLSRGDFLVPAKTLDDAEMGVAIERLIRSGLVRRAYSPGVPLLIAVIGLFSLLGVGWITDEALLATPIQSRAIVRLMLVTFGGLSVLLAGVAYSMKRPTRLGRRLIELYEEYRSSTFN